MADSLYHSRRMRHFPTYCADDAPLDKLDDTLRDEGAETLGDKLGDVEAMQHVVSQSVMLEKAKAEALDRCTGKALADILACKEANTLRDMEEKTKAETHCYTMGDKLPDARSQTLGKILVNVKAMTLVDIPALTLIKSDAKTLGNPLGVVEYKALIETLADTLAETETETLGDRLDVVEAIAMGKVSA